MCGIVGVLELTKPSLPVEPIVRRMSDRIKHRGPDDHGFFSQGPIHFGFRRLAILDLSPAGHQPMQTADRTLTVIFNGEIYNYLELSEELRQLGVVFQSKSDTEVILYAYQQWGPECVKKFNGMWAFAIWDEQKQRLFCSRDRFGVKPFYYSMAGGQFVFGSEIKALLEHPAVKKEPNHRRLYDYLTYGYQDHTAETFFAGIEQLLPGHSVLVRVGHDPVISRHWAIDPSRVAPPATTAEYADTFLKLFRDSIRLRLRSDVAIGSCLSGGLDSSSIVCVVNEMLRSEHPGSIGDRQKTFSAVYDEAEADEREYSQAVINQTGAAQYLVMPKGDDVARDLHDVIYYQDEPFGSTSIFAQWYVMKRAHQEGLKVMLDGQGADELLAGYFGYFGSSIASLVKQFRWLQAQREISAWQKNHESLGKHYLYHVMASMAMKLLPPFAVRWASAVTRVDGSLFLDRNFYAQYRNDIPRLQHSYRDPLKNELHRVLKIGLPALLHFEDRDSMAWSIEARVPFLDYRLVEYVFSLPNEQKINGGMTKIILRNAMKGVLPEKVRTRQSKLGFATPEKKWLTQSLRPVMHEVLHSSSLAKRGVLNMPSAQQFFAQAMNGSYHRYVDSPTIWRWVNMELWWRRFID